MSRSAFPRLRAVLVVTLTLALGWFGGGWWKVSRWEREFAYIKPGMPQAEVMARMGRPTKREPEDAQAWRGFALGPCTAPCFARHWYWDRRLPGLQAWSIEFDDAARVSRSTHWVSP